MEVAGTSHGGGWAKPVARCHCERIIVGGLLGAGRSGIPAGVWRLRSGGKVPEGDARGSRGRRDEGHLRAGGLPMPGCGTFFVDLGI